ncbi:MAG: hypothetical protein PHX01_04865 [Clostridia bacterium]|jgi:hypothetical protein|nr:hypothetical protein [Clostridia bacterium]
MRKKSLLMVSVLLCLASLMVAMAYTSAEVQAGYTVNVVASDKALLALIPNDEANADGTADIVDGNLVLNFGQVGDGTCGLQPGGTYIWSDLVQVKNNSQNKILVTFEVVESNGDKADYLTVVKYKNKNWHEEIEELELKGKGKNGDEEFIGFEIKVPVNAEVGQVLQGKIIVTAIDKKYKNK